MLTHCEKVVSEQCTSHISIYLSIYIFFWEDQHGMVFLLAIVSRIWEKKVWVFFWQMLFSPVAFYFHDFFWYEFLFPFSFFFSWRKIGLNSEEKGRNSFHLTTSCCVSCTAREHDLLKNVSDSNFRNLAFLMGKCNSFVPTLIRWI